MPQLFMIAVLTLLAGLPLAARADEAVAIPAQKSLEERLQELEMRQAELYHSLAQKKEAGLAEQLTERLSVSGLLEVEASAATVSFTDGSDAATSNLTLATVQLGFDMKLNENVGGKLILLYEQEGELEVDEATIDLARGPLFLRVGRQYLPFGYFYSHFISDPLTQELGETRATSLLIGYNDDLFTLSAFAFNGNNDEVAAEDHINDGGASLTVTLGEGLELGGSYISDLAESNAELLVAPYARRVDGWSAFVHHTRGAFSFEAEYLAAVRAFAPVDLDADHNGRGDRPQAWNLECAYRPVAGLELALRYEGSSAFVAQPETQYGFAVSWSPWEHTTLALEYLHGIFDPAFADGAATREQVTTQLALAF